MGNVLFKPKKLSPEEEQRRLEQLHGVLIPPLFTVSHEDGYATTGSSSSSSDCDQIPISTQAQWKAIDSPNLVHSLWRLTAGHNLLEEYMSPGIFFAVPTNATGKIHMALNTPNRIIDPSTINSPTSSSTINPRTTTTSVPSTTAIPFTSFVSLSQTLAAGSKFPIDLQLLVPASPHCYPCIDVVSSTLIPHTTISARCNPFQPNDKIGHVSATVKLQPVPQIHVLLGAWMNADSIHNLIQEHYYKESKNDHINDTESTAARWYQSPLVTSSSLSSFSLGQSSTRNYSPSTLHIQGVAEYHESIIASHAEIPLSPNSGQYVPEQLDTMLWINLSGNSNNSDENYDPHKMEHPTANDNDNNHHNNTTMPPLWLTLKQSTTRGCHDPHYTLNLSQILSFDRTCWNILEDRAPRIRNHVGWTFQLDRKNDRQASWSVAASWQINRNVALKAVLDNGSFVRTNLILKKWQQPRMTLSMINGINLSNGQVMWLGCGIEVETTTTKITSDRLGGNGKTGDRTTAATTAGYQETVNVDGISAPPTKVQVPSLQTKRG
ncbi:hypothetical protein IV203_025359 [Nitzschia inconspicua]|uniref:Uncharacterized protein n=1 Tax=Nitzschia inconspicua TaxID=303405 RepID=A0A9K3P9Q7_9STRA|nr:hypothetical protein IV203_024832 [Nitzschia inconspicua]KAG7362475.1 hypothetical protein IV203_025359 [Nitzschia inconspicua]